MSSPKITSAVLHTAVHRPEQFPRDHHPEVAFLGRSNVGKSSLINTLLVRRGLVRTSRRPGCTRSVNFFLVNERWFFVDLPGYGYAAVSQKVKAGWGDLIMTYLAERQNLAAVVFLHDSRRLPGPAEMFLWEMLKTRGNGIIPVLTKADQLKPGERARQLPKILEALKPLGVSAADFLWFSAVTGEGRDKLWPRLRKYLEKAP